MVISNLGALQEKTRDLAGYKDMACKYLKNRIIGSGVLPTSPVKLHKLEHGQIDEDIPNLWFCELEMMINSYKVTEEEEKFVLLSTFISSHQNHDVAPSITQAIQLLLEAYNQIYAMVWGGIFGTPIGTELYNKLYERIVVHYKRPSGKGAV